MNQALTPSGWDTPAIAIPFVVLLAVGMFRLDEVIAAPQRRAARRRTFCGPDGNGDASLYDPDGRPWSPSVPARRTAAFDQDETTIEASISVVATTHILDNKNDSPVDLVINSRRTILR